MSDLNRVLTRIARLLPGPHTDIQVFPSRAGATAGLGVGGSIGYHIVRSYLRHHPTTTAASLTDRRAATIYAASHYFP